LTSGARAATSSTLASSALRARSRAPPKARRARTPRTTASPRPATTTTQAPTRSRSARKGFTAAAGPSRAPASRSSSARTVRRPPRPALPLFRSAPTRQAPFSTAPTSWLALKVATALVGASRGLGRPSPNALRARRPLRQALRCFRSVLFSPDFTMTAHPSCSAPLATTAPGDPSTTPSRRPALASRPVPPARRPRASALATVRSAWPAPSASRTG